ncbi:MAG: hypothetical protein ACK47E_05565 [Cyclobacteriaceae bacterium]|jgi:hypothetical protein
METLVLKFKSKKNYRLIKELASRLEGKADDTVKELKAKELPKGKFKSEKEFRALGGIAKGQLISKEHLRSLSWKKRDW